MDVELQILKHLKRDAQTTVTMLVEFGFKLELVLADSLYGEASSFITTLNKYELLWILAIRNNHGVWMPSNQKVRANKWCKFERIFSNKKAVRPRVILKDCLRGVRSGIL